MRFVLSLILVASFSTHADAQWRDICPESHPDGIELPLSPLVAGTPAGDEGITSVMYPSMSLNFYGSPATSFRVLSKGLMTFRYVDIFSLGATGVPMHYPTQDRIHHIMAPFWADLADVRVCSLEEPDRLIVQ